MTCAYPDGCTTTVTTTAEVVHNPPPHDLAITGFNVVFVVWVAALLILLGLAVLQVVQNHDTRNITIYRSYDDDSWIVRQDLDGYRATWRVTRTLLGAKWLRFKWGFFQ